MAIILNINNGDGTKSRRTFKGLEAARQAAWLAVGRAPAIEDGRAFGPDGKRGPSLTCKGASFAELFLIKQAGELVASQQDSAVTVVPPVAAPAKITHLPEDKVLLLATVPSGSHSALNYDIVRDQVTSEIRCECLGFAYSSSEPKLCAHIRGLVGTGVFKDREDELFRDAAAQLEARTVAHKASAGDAMAKLKTAAAAKPDGFDTAIEAVAAVCKAMRGKRIAAFTGDGKVSDDAAKLMTVCLANISTEAAAKRYDGVCGEFKADRALALQAGAAVAMRVGTRKGAAEVLPSVIEALKLVGLESMQASLTADDHTVLFLKKAGV